MCGLSQDSGIGKAWNKTSNFIHEKTLGGKVAQGLKKGIMGEEFVENGGLQGSFYKDYKSEEKKKKADILASAPALDSPDYVKWYNANRQTLLG